jgi:Holliday junction resolvasome RuvABC endonuclease subunit
MKLILGIDPGFASLGWCRFALGKLPELDRVVQMGVIRTDKSNKKAKVLASHDNHRRIAEIFRQLFPLAQEVVMFTAESQSWPRNSASSAKVGMAWGVISSLAELLEVPLLQMSPQAMKKSICGNKSASKKEIADALIARYGIVIADVLLKDVAPSQREHAFDALGSVCATLEGEEVKLARQMMT